MIRVAIFALYAVFVVLVPCGIISLAQSHHWLFAVLLALVASLLYGLTCLFVVKKAKEETAAALVATLALTEELALTTEETTS